MDLDYLHIDLKSLDYGRTERTLSLDDAYFEAIDAPEVRRGNLSVRIAIDRTSQDAFLLDFHITGTVTVSCDRCLDDMELPIEAQERMEAKFGEESSEDDACVTVAEDEGILDVAWLIYELTALAIPVRHVHTGARGALGRPKRRGRRESHRPALGSTRTTQEKELKNKTD